MNKLFSLAVLALSLPARGADAPAAPSSCAELRTEIAAQKGIPEVANLALLRRLSGRTDCGFTAAEVYRAAVGERPFPADEPRRWRHRHDGDDD